ncbi:hypothetical protein ABZS66_11665 [Dactylosporangium sp. NPDC005572]|uniref:alpha/beta fold hydrolase n=1 Tax=Dactylosporangium sp. NPDC005572 TaxID=3156889 RepID=UPI0033A609A9
MGQDNLEEFGAALTGETALRPLLVAASSELVAVGPDGLADAMQSLLPPVDAALLNSELAVFMNESMVRGQRHGVDGWLDDDIAFTRPYGFDLTSIKVPVLLMQGRYDMMVPFAHGQWLASHIPDATAELTEYDGHLTLITRVHDVHTWLLAQH